MPYRSLRHSLGFVALLSVASGALAESPPEIPLPPPPPAAQSQPAATQTASNNPDPWESFNRRIFRFNDTADRYVLKPVAKGYKRITPSPVRTGITNFFQNLGTPLDALNNLLQGKPAAAGKDTLRFLMNSTAGLLGFIDIGSRVNLPASDEDFGQTLGVWGLPSGPYVVLPFMGPSSVRDGSGLVVDAVANPRRYVLETDADVALWAAEVVNMRAGLLDVEDIIQGDRYLFIRDAYLQSRASAVKDGKVESDPFLDDDMSDDGASDATSEAALVTEPNIESSTELSLPQETDNPAPSESTETPAEASSLVIPAAASASSAVAQ